MLKIKRELFLIVFLSVISLIQINAQDIDFIRIPHTSPISKSKNTRILATGDTLQLPFFENFNFHETDNQPKLNLWEPNSGVYVNNHYPVNQPEFNVASFDGLQSNGEAYTWVTALINNNLSKSGLGDKLTSKPINLSKYKAANKVGFSFSFQMGAIDSGLFPLVERGYLLKLYFLDSKGKYNLIFPNASDSTILKSTTTTPFTDRFYELTDSNYLHSAFRFKFEITGSTTSNLDMWSIDDIYIDTNRTNASIPDIGFSNTPTTLLKTYHSIPFRHFKNYGKQFLTETTTSTISNISINDTLFIDPDTVRLVEVLSNTILQTTRSNDNDFPNAGIIYPKNRFPLPFTLDKDNLMSSLSGLNQNAVAIKNLFKFQRNATQFSKSNDSISRITYLDQYYAYDDGTAEIAGGAGGENQYTQLACKFDLLQEDTLTTIYIHFPKYTYNHTGESVNIKVWKFLENVDGAKKDSLLYNNYYNITYIDSLMYGFHAYRLDRDIFLDKGSFYIGIEYTSAKRLYIGIDVSNNSIDKCYTNLDYNGWSQSFKLYYNIKGSLMMRPKFGTKKDIIQAIEETVSTKNIALNQQVVLFPNPTTNKIKIESKYQVNEIEIHTIQGEHLTTIKAGFSNTIELDVQNLSSGIYIANIHTTEGKITKKFMKE